MKQSWLVIGLSLASALVAAGPDKPRGQQKAAKPDTAIGCVDQRGETYVLTGDRQLKTKYTLHGADFKDDNFARYLGHKVKVTGKLESGEVFRVKQIDNLEGACAPAETEQ